MTVVPVTLTIPRLLRERAREEGLSLSKVLTAALEKELEQRERIYALAKTWPFS